MANRNDDEGFWVFILIMLAALIGGGHSPDKKDGPKTAAVADASAASVATPQQTDRSPDAGPATASSTEQRLAALAARRAAIERKLDRAEGYLRN
jgi:hypothetical protein